MTLTPQQLSALKTELQTDPAGLGYAAFLVPEQESFSEVQALINAVAVPAFYVWRTSVSEDEIMQNGFDWVRVDNLSIGKARIWDWLFRNQRRVINPSKANVRAGIAECWKGTTADLAVQAAVLAHCKRPATRGERIFATGNGAEATPATMAFEGQISVDDLVTAWRLP